MKITQVDTILNDNPKTLASSISYLPYGGITGLTYGNALSLTHGCDTQYRTSSIVVGSVLDRTYTYDANGNITSIDDGEAAGNETLESAGIYSYDQGTNLLADMWREIPVVYDYDENGNTISANNRTFTYDLSNRLITVQEGSTTLGQYVYNALNQRIKKTVQGQATIFHYDLQGHLIAETTESGTTLAEYIYLGDQPLAMIRPSEALYYFHNDHLGTPQILTNDSGTVSWKAAYTPFGEAVISVETVENPLRFPGQYYDSETGLHYNWNRYYDPKTGRYLTPDPIGLEERINLFVYVANNPLISADPLGLYECTYYIQEHRMTCTPRTIPHPSFDSNDFVSGNNNLPGPLDCRCQNNPERTDVPFHGPIPVGDYIIGPPRGNPAHRALLPEPYNNMQTRVRFQIHGCRIPSECSEGCIGATSNKIRDRFNYLMSLEEGDNFLRVVP